MAAGDVNSQNATFNLYFNSGQKTVAATQRLELEKLAFKYTRPTRITIYPLIFDKQRNVWAYSMFANEQAQSIMKHAKELGFKVIGAPENFPSGYYGRSKSVVLQIIPKKHQKHVSCKVLEDLRNPLLPLYGVKPSQFYTIDPNKDTILYGKEGTVLYIKAKAFIAKDSVKVELKEFYTLADYIKSALPSVSNGKLLETGGTIYLNAKTKNNTTVPINKSKGIGIDFSKGKDDKEMNIFYQDRRSPTELNWIKQSKHKVTITKKWSMTETKLGPEGNVISKRVFHSKADWNRYRDSLNLAVKKEKEKKESIAASKKMLEGKLKTFNLGLINCDKFYGEETAPFTFQKNDTFNCNYYIVFKDIRGVLNGSLNPSGRISFGNVPIGSIAYVIAVSYLNNQAYFDKVLVNTSSKKVNLNLTPVSKATINQELAVLN